MLTTTYSVQIWPDVSRNKFEIISLTFRCSEEPVPTVTVEDHEEFLFNDCFGYTFDGCTTRELFSQNGCALQTDESVTCMLNVAILDWITANVAERSVGMCGGLLFFSALIVFSEKFTQPWVLTHPHSRWWFCFGLIPQRSPVDPARILLTAEQIPLK